MILDVPVDAVHLVPGHLAAGSAGLLVGGYNATTVWLLDADTAAVRSAVAVPDGEIALEVSAAGGDLWVFGGGGNV